MRKEQVLDSKGRYFTKESLIFFIKETLPEEYENLKTLLYRWSIEIIRGKRKDVLVSVKSYLPQFLSLFQKEIEHSLQFIEGSLSSPVTEQNNYQNSQINKANFHGFDIEIATIHSVKGQTHTATLYLETDYYGCEASKMSNQYKFNLLKNNVGVRVKQSAKMFYVGISRPTHLLCVAVRIDRFDSFLSDIDREKWEIINLT
jgi:hypothetical protein